MDANLIFASLSQPVCHFPLFVTSGWRYLPSVRHKKIKEVDVQTAPCRTCPGRSRRCRQREICTRMSVQVSVNKLASSLCGKPANVKGSYAFAEFTWLTKVFQLTADFIWNIYRSFMIQGYRSYNRATVCSV